MILDDTWVCSARFFNQFVAAFRGAAIEKRKEADCPVKVNESPSFKELQRAEFVRHEFHLAGR